MTERLLIVLMSALGICLAINPSINSVNVGLFKGLSWLLSGILSKLK